MRRGCGGIRYGSDSSGAHARGSSGGSHFRRRRLAPGRCLVGAAPTREGDLNALLDAAVVAVIGTVTALWVARRLDGIVNPVSLYISAWTACLSLFLLRLLPYEYLRPSTVAIIWTSSGCFIGGVLITRLRGWRALSADIAGRYSRQDAAATRNVITVIMVTLLGLEMLAFSLYLIEVASIRGIGSFLTNLAAVRILKPDLRYPAILLWAGAIYCWLLAAGRAHDSPDGLPRWLMWGVPVALIPFLMTTGRTELFFVAITAVVARFLRDGRHISLTKFELAVTPAIAVILLVFFVGLSYLLGKFAADTAVEFGFPERLILLADPYIYATGGFAALNQLLSDVTVGGDLSGPLTFWPAHRLLYALGVAPTPVSWVADYVEIPNLFNTYTFLEPYYRDYGVLGCFGASFTLGVIGGVLHQVAVIGSMAGARIPYAIFAFAIFISPFVNHFSQLVVPFLIVVFTGLTWAAGSISNARRNHVFGSFLAS